MAVKIDIFLNKQKGNKTKLTNIQLIMKYNTTIPINDTENIPPYFTLVYK
jgi:hypothetical protein